MFAMFNRFFVMISSFLQAGERVANSANYAAEVMETKAKHFRDLEVAKCTAELAAMQVKSLPAPAKDEAEAEAKPE